MTMGAESCYIGGGLYATRSDGSCIAISIGSPNKDPICYFDPSVISNLARFANSLNPDIPAKWRSEPLSKAEEAYARNHAGAMNLLNLIREKLENLPAPDSDVDINWAHVGSLSHINEKLLEIAEFLHSHDCPS